MITRNGETGGALASATSLVTPFAFDTDYVGAPIALLVCSAGGAINVVAAGDPDSSAVVWTVTAGQRISDTFIRKILSAGTTLTAGQIAAYR